MLESKIIMDIRELREGELPELLDLYKHLHEEDDILPANEVVDGIWKDITDSENFRYFGVFTDDGHLLSSCTISIIPNLTRGARPYGLIENVVTSKKERRKGFGTKLLQHVQEAAWDVGCYKVMLLTGRKDESTLRFYEKAGFHPHVKTGFISYPPE